MHGGHAELAGDKEQCMAELLARHGIGDKAELGVLRDISRAQFRMRRHGFGII